MGLFMNKGGIIVVSLAILAAGLFYVKQEAKDPSVAQKAAAIEAENFATWQEFKPRSGLFSVLLPHAPQYAKDFIPIPGSDQKRRYDMYVSEKIDGTLFLISVITYPTVMDTSETADILKQTVDELMRSKPDNKLSKTKEGLFKTFQSLDFTIVNSDIVVDGLTFMDGKSVYVLSYVTRKGDFDADEYKHFIDSFQLLPEVEK